MFSCICRLIESVLERFKREMDDTFDLLRATLCLLETSKSGLLEVELLEILPEFDRSRSLCILYVYNNIMLSNITSYAIRNFQ